MAEWRNGRTLRTRRGIYFCIFGTGRLHASGSARSAVTHSRRCLIGVSTTCLEDLPSGAAWNAQNVLVALQPTIRIRRLTDGQLLWFLHGPSKVPFNPWKSESLVYFRSWHELDRSPSASHSNAEIVSICFATVACAAN